MNFIKNYIIKIAVLLLIMFYSLLNINTVFALENNKLEEGIYIIKSALNEKFVFDIKDDSKEDGANVQLWSDSQSYCQRFMVKSLGNDVYSIYAIYDSKYIDVSGNSQKLGANVVQWSGHGGTNQQWIIKDAGNGYYNIISKCNGLYIDIPQSNAKNGANVQLWSKNNAKNQLFKFEKVQDSLVGQKTINDGIYSIKTALNEKFVFDIEYSSKQNGANLELYNEQNTNNQQYTFKYLNNGTYSISPVHSQKYLDVGGSSKEIGANVAQWSGHGGENQQWIIKDAGNGYYNIISKCNGLYIDIPQSNAKNGANVQLWSKNNSKNQLFKLQLISSTNGGEKTIQNGVYHIKSVSNSKVLDVNGSSLIDNGNIGFWNNGSTANQKFAVTYLNNGYYKIIAQHSGKAVKIIDQTNGSNVMQGEYKGNGNDQWIIKDAGNGCYNIVSRSTGNYLKQTSDGNAIIEKNNNANDQKFKFEVPTPLKGSKTIENGTYILKIAQNNEYVVDIPRKFTKR